MKKSIFTLVVVLMALLAMPVRALASESQEGEAEGGKLGFEPKEIIFEHLGDAYGWEVPFNHHVRIPLPIIVWASDGLHVFSSNRLAHGQEYKDGDLTFRIQPKGSEEYSGKVVEVMPDGQVLRPWDISITKNVLAIFITVFVVAWCVLAVARWHKRMGVKTPRKFLGALESLYMFIYDGMIKPILRDKAMKFAPYLLTVFMFIFVSNLMGLIVVFPGGANLTGNIAVTLTLAVITFFVTNLWGTKHYWKDIFWPDVPLWLKFPIPIMPIIEIFGVFTKPAALTVRLFANMMGGHMIVIVLTMLIFIFSAIGGAWVAGATTVMSMLFSIFMLLIDTLVSFIQAFVFTMLSTIFISLAQEEGHKKHEEDPEAAAAPAPAN